MVIAGSTAYYQPHGKRIAAPKSAGLCGELGVGSNIVESSDWTTSCGPLPNDRDDYPGGRSRCGLMQSTKSAPHGHGSSTKMRQVGWRRALISGPLPGLPRTA